MTTDVPAAHRETGATSRADYADPEGYKYPIHREENVRAAISYFRRYGSRYSPAKRVAVWGRIRAAAKRFGIEIAEPDQQVEKGRRMSPIVLTLHSHSAVLSKSHLADKPWFEAYQGTPFWERALDLEKKRLEAEKKMLAADSARSTPTPSYTWVDFDRAKCDLELERLDWMKRQARKAETENDDMDKAEVMKAIRDFRVPTDLATLAKGESSEGLPSPGGAGGSETKLSEDDVTIAQQLHAGDPKSAKKLAQGAEGGSSSDIGAGITKGAVTGDDPAALYPVRMQGMRSDGTWTQGPDARVLYSNVSDGIIAKAIEDGTISPEVGSPLSSPLYGLNKCHACGSGFAKALTVCPGCGVDRFGAAPTGTGIQMSKAVRDAVTPPADGDIHFR